MAHLRRVQFFAFTQCFSRMNSYISKCKICIMPKLSPNLSITLGTLSHFQNKHYSRTDCIPYGSSFVSYQVFLSIFLLGFFLNNIQQFFIYPNVNHLSVIYTTVSSPTLWLILSFSSWFILRTKILHFNVTEYNL